MARRRGRGGGERAEGFGEHNIAKTISIGSLRKFLGLVFGRLFGTIMSFGLRKKTRMDNKCYVLDLYDDCGGIMEVKRFLPCLFATSIVSQLGQGQIPRPDTPRAEIDEMFKWELTHLFQSEEEWEKRFSEVKGRFAEIQTCRGKVTKDKKSFHRCLKLVFDLFMEVDTLMTYANALYSVDRTDARAKERVDRAVVLSSQLSEVTAFLEPELLQADAKKLLRFVRKYEENSEFRHYIEDLVRRKSHVLSPEEERIIALSNPVRSAPFQVLSALEEDVKFEDVIDENGNPVPLTRASFPKLRASYDRDVRKRAVSAFFAGLRGFGRSFAASLDAQIRANVFVAKARHYGSALEASLDRNAIPLSVYESLLKATSDALPRTLHRYVRLRQKVLGVETLHYYDLYVPLVRTPKREIPYETAASWIVEAMSPLGEEYCETLKEGLDLRSKWVDLYPNKGKRSGAYCTAAYRKHPLVFLNYMGEIEDVFTVAHEFGHAMHFYLSHRAQPYPTADAPIFLAEIASTFHEEMLLSYLLKRAKDKEERLYLLNRRLENIRTTVFRQVMFAEFEKELYDLVERGEGLSAERLYAIYKDLLRKYYGDSYQIDEDDAWEWAYIPHFYYNFYVYQYATGLMSAIALQRKVEMGEEGARERYLALLEAGGSDYPVILLQKAGVDPTKTDFMEYCFRLFEETLEEFEKAWEE